MKSFITAALLMVGVGSVHAQTSTSQSTTSTITYSREYSVTMVEKDKDDRIKLVTVGAPTTLEGCRHRAENLGIALGILPEPGQQEATPVSDKIAEVDCLELGIESGDTSEHVYGSNVATKPTSEPSYGFFNAIGGAPLLRTWTLEAFKLGGTLDFEVPNFRSKETCEEMIRSYNDISQHPNGLNDPNNNPFTDKLLCIHK
jgi:hypothetical protein